MSIAPAATTVDQGPTTAVVPAGATCGWCRELLGTTNPRARFCGRKCRQTAFRLRRRGLSSFAGADRRLRFAYADPPYIGLSSKYYRREATFGGEVDHAALLSRLEERRQAGELAGWALSASSRSLATLLPLCPPGHRVCAWVKPHTAPAATYGLHSCWEPLIVVGGRQRRPGFPDWLSALPARNGGTLPGRKPIAFCWFLFRALGMVPGDELDDLFPGTGVVSRAWVSLSAANDGRSSTNDAPSLAAVNDAQRPE